ncbi:hypothetical protein CHARACLAT_027481 [Characodon lateralis]|uniref:G-protein coupled receptors family 1 profile domain-containing protein n=2 Tax=Goodeidae TaxID=28758 RepID=A0ABU7EMR7_9TELE|nr:hypothetical protein [Characodon lateralis]
MKLMIATLSLSQPEMDSFRILLYSLIFLLSVFGNLLIIVVLMLNKRMRTVTNSFLLSLAVSDLMMAIFCMPFTLIPNILEDFIFGATMCKIVTYLMGEPWFCLRFSHTERGMFVQIKSCLRSSIGFRSGLSLDHSNT